MPDATDRPAGLTRSPLLPAPVLVSLVLGIVPGGVWFQGEARSSLFPIGWLLPAGLGPGAAHPAGAIPTMSAA